jgi:hypothetical protein
MYSVCVFSRYCYGYIYYLSERLMSNLNFNLILRKIRKGCVEAELEVEREVPRKSQYINLEGRDCESQAARSPLSSSIFSI